MRHPPRARFPRPARRERSVRGWLVFDGAHDRVGAVHTEARVNEFLGGFAIADIAIRYRENLRMLLLLRRWKQAVPVPPSKCLPGLKPRRH